MTFKKPLIIILILAFAIGFIYFISSLISSNSVNGLINQKYSDLSKSIRRDVEIAVADKTNATLALSLAISKDSMLKKALLEHNYKLIDLKGLSNLIKKYTDFKNPWFQIVSHDGNTLLRSWTEKKDDNISRFRIDIAKMLKEPKVMTTISVGKFNMTFKAMVPVYNNKEFIGMFEVITNFDSVAKNLQDYGIEAVILADKKYKKQIKKPYTKTFIEDYYVANIKAKKSLVSFIEKAGVEHFINDNNGNYHIYNKIDSLVTNYNLPDIYGNPMGYFVLFKDLKSISLIPSCIEPTTKE